MQFRTMVMKHEASWINKRSCCRLCGNYVRNNETFCLIVGNGINNNVGNFIVHENEWNDYIRAYNNVETKEDYKRCIDSFEKRRIKVEKIVADAEHIRLFKESVAELSGTLLEENSNSIWFKVATVKFRFTKATETLECKYRRKSKVNMGNLIDSMYVLEIQSRIMENYKLKIGQQPPEPFRANDVISKSIEEAKNLFNRG